MTVAPLQLKFYFVSDLHFTTNKDFDVNKDPELRQNDFLVKPDIHPEPDKPREFQVVLTISHQAAAGTNAPYFFNVEVVGFFEVAEAFPAERIDRLITVNGPSVLYGIARDVVRDVTSRGPYFSVLLPSVSFYEDSPQAEEGKPTNRLTTSAESQAALHNR
jgi:preprotein translocase subunit SecB